MSPDPALELDIGGQTVKVSNPDKVFFATRGETKLDLVKYYVSVAEGALLGVRNRPTVLKRYPGGAESEPFFQKRVPPSAPSWIPRVTISFPSGRTADELCPTHISHIAWAANLGCLDLNPWAVRSSDVDHPDELRVDLDPQPGVSFDLVRRAAMHVKDVLDEHGLEGYPKTSGSRGIHINIRVEPKWGFLEMRRAALALAREVERRDPKTITTKWWKEERGERVFVDFNQNARDRTVASAYSVRANPEGRVSAPLTWNEVPEVEPQDLTIATVPERYAKLGDVGAGIDSKRFSLESLLDMAARDEAGGLGDAPWPPNFAKMPGEPKRVQPSRAKNTSRAKNKSACPDPGE